MNLKNEIRKNMRMFVEDCRDPKTGEINSTMLAENTAYEMVHDEWLDDPDHVIWDIALEFE